MADIAEDLRTHLSLHPAGAGDAVGGRIHQTHMPQRSQYPALYMIRSGREEDLTLDGRDPEPLVRELWDIEVLSEDLDEANTIADQVADALHGVRGSDFLGVSNTVQGIFLEDKDDDYVPRGAGTDAGISVAAFSCTIWYEQALTCEMWLSTLTLSQLDTLTLDELSALCL